MKVLLVVQDQQRVNLDEFYAAIGCFCECELRRLSKAEQKKLKLYFSSINAACYDRIVMFSRFKHDIRQLDFIRTLPNLVLLEHDAWQNYYPDSKYFGKFSRHYREVSWARILVSGAVLASKLSAEGFDAHYLPKGYDNLKLSNLNRQRDVEVGFVGSIAHKSYQRRKEFLQSAVGQLGLKVMRTHSGEDYGNMLNRIKFFISADIGFGEFMIKNFEAMACGCVLFAYDQGAEESRALGLIDMKNIVFYKNLPELKRKLEVLRADNRLARNIAAGGQEHVENMFNMNAVAERFVELIGRPLRPFSGGKFGDFFKYYFRH